MTGVEILATEQVVVEIAYNWLAAGFCFLAIVVFGVIIGAFIKDFNKVLGTLIGGLAGLLAGTLAWCVVIAVTSKPIAYEANYKVIISGEVSMTEFLERYEIIDQDGKIFTVREVE